MQAENTGQAAKKPQAAGRQRDKPGIATVLKTLGQFISMTLFIAILTALADTGLARAGKNRAASRRAPL